MSALVGAPICGLGAAEISPFFKEDSEVECGVDIDRRGVDTTRASVARIRFDLARGNR
jgi:hypothetical protein